MSCEEFKHLGQNCSITNPCGFLWNPDVCQQNLCTMSCDQDLPCPLGMRCELDDAGESGFCKSF